MAPTYDALLVTDDEHGVRTVTLNAPAKKNALSRTMFLELRAEFRSLSADPSQARCIVVTGAGGEFCSGADLSEPTERPVHGLEWMRQVGEACAALHALPQPVIAKVVGVAAGAGCNLALGCDLVVAADNARFIEIFAKRGLSVDFGGSWLLPRLVGLHKAKELALLADAVPAAEAERIGLVNRVVGVDEIDAFVDDWARRLAGGPPIALGLTKKLLNGAFQSTIEQALEVEAIAQNVNFPTEDTREAMLAFIQKRTPTFHGR